ncbi:MAG: helix-turn-helix domain-containing protein [Janthinobacterium lividum]
MTNSLQKQLQAIIRDNNMTIPEVERKAGLRLNAVRNIVTGLSKKPSAETLQAIADTFNCSVKDLLQQEDKSFSQHQDDNMLIERPELFLTCVGQFLEVCQQQLYKPTLKKSYSMICDLYFYSCEKESKIPDEAFIRWLIKRNI